MNYQSIYKAAKEWAYQAGAILKQAVTEEVKVEYKTSAADLVTEKDKEVEQFFVEQINKRFPDHYILGEEGAATEQGSYQPEEEMVWLVDPIDGTTNFVHLKRNFCVSIGVYDHGRPVVGVIYDPMAEEMFHALTGEGVYLNDKKVTPPEQQTAFEQALITMNHLWLAPNEYLKEQPLQQMAGDIRGFRCIGSAAIELAYTAVGRFDGSIFIGLGPWDFGAAYVLLKEQGLKVSTVGGSEVGVFNKSSFLTASEELHQLMQSNYIQPK